MGTKADLDVALYQFDQLNLGSDLDALLAEAIQAKSVFNAHTHTAVATAPSTSVSAASADGISNLAIRGEMAQNLSGLGSRFTLAYTDAVAVINDFKTKFNAHTHTTTTGGAGGGVPGSSISLTEPPAIAASEEERWNRAYHSFQAASVGSKVAQIVVISGQLKSVYNAHSHGPAMTNAPSGSVAAVDPSTLT